jgi:hypothetical protein
MDSIFFNRVLYPIRTIDLIKWGVVNISTTNLECLLLDSNTDDYVSDEARSIDEMIFYYVEKNQLNLPKLEFTQLLQSELN